MTISTREKDLIRQSFACIKDAPETAAELFYGRLFEIDPALRALFRGDMREQGRKLMQTIAVAVASLDRFEELVPAVRTLGARHGSYGVRDEHYAIVAQALLWTLGTALGSRFTEETRGAWTALYALLSETMRSAAAQAQAVPA